MKRQSSTKKAAPRRRKVNVSSRSLYRMGGTGGAGSPEEGGAEGGPEGAEGGAEGGDLVMPGAPSMSPPPPLPQTDDNAPPQPAGSADSAGSPLSPQEDSSAADQPPNADAQPEGESSADGGEKDKPSFLGTIQKSANEAANSALNLFSSSKSNDAPSSEPVAAELPQPANIPTQPVDSPNDIIGTLSKALANSSENNAASLNIISNFQKNIEEKIDGLSAEVSQLKEAVNSKSSTSSSMDGNPEVSNDQLMPPFTGSMGAADEAGSGDSISGSKADSESLATTVTEAEKPPSLATTVTEGDGTSVAEGEAGSPSMSSMENGSEGSGVMTSPEGGEDESGVMTSPEGGEDESGPPKLGGGKRTRRQRRNNRRSRRFKYRYRYVY